MADYLKYPEYAPSPVDWLGDLPKHWQISRVKFIFRILKRICGELGHDVLSITQKGVKLKDTESGDGQLSSDYSKYQIVEPGDFAMNHMDLLTGYIDISPYQGVTSPDYRVFRLVRTNYCDRYYLYLWQMGYQQKIFFHFGQGSAHLGRWRLPAEAFKDLIFPVPPTKEQLKIAAFLDHETAKIDRLIARQKRLIELLKEKRRAVISHAVTQGLNPDAPMKDSGVEWLGEVPAHWKVTKTGYLSSKIGSGKTPRGGAEIYEESGVLFLRSQNVYDEGLRIADSEVVFISEAIDEEMSSTRVKPGDILLNITGGSIGRTCLTPANMPPANVNQHVCILRFREEFRKFLAYVIKSVPIKEQIDWLQTGGNREGLNFEQIAKLVFSLPPVDELSDISEYIYYHIMRIDELIDKVYEAARLLNEHRTALISAAVTGKIDVRGWQKPNTKSEETAAAVSA